MTGRASFILNFFKSLLIAGFCISPGHPSEADQGKAPDSKRLPEKPAWEVTLTPRMERLPLAIESIDQAIKAAGTPYAEALSRAHREATLDRQGKKVWWRVQVALPPEARTDKEWPVVLDVDEGRVIDGAWLDGQSFGGFDGKDQTGRIVSGEGSVALPGFDSRERGSLWSSGEGSLLLPLHGARDSGELILCVQDLPHLYETGFGQLRLRPATLDEVLRIERDGNGKVRVLNRGPIPLDIQLHIRDEDYFGVVLKDEVKPLPLQPGESLPLSLSPPASADFYKTRLWATVGPRQTMEYWNITDLARDERVRPHVKRLDQGWEWVFVPGPHEQNPPPDQGWRPAVLPHDIPKDAYTSHWMWYRNRFTIPKDWKGERVQLMLPGRIFLQARVVLDGKVIGEYPNWELPKYLLLPDTLTPGSEHELLIGVTDYIVALAPGIQPPAAGPMNPAARGLIAPNASTTAMGIGIRNVPELISVPEIRTDWTAIRTTLGSKTPRLAASLELVNDSAREARVNVRASVREKGREVLPFPAEEITLPAGKVTPVEIATDWPAPRLWTLEDPWLYELRLELVDPAGRVLDARRERFGFREFGIEGDHFTLNGKRVNLLGGSHVVLQALTWPVRHQPFNFLRHFGNNQPSTFMSGRAVSHLADEMGYLVKNENGNLNAHHMDNYAWQEPLLWERAATQMKSLFRSQPNHPSTVVWDVGNELVFRGPGEADKMTALLARVREMDPTRHTTVGGSAPFPPAAEVWDVHGWGNWSNRSDYYLYHPEDRPDYLRKSGVYAHKPQQDVETDWQVDLKNVGESPLTRPNDNNKLHHWDGKPVIFSEGHYYESQVPVSLLGHLAYQRLVREGTEKGLDRYMSYHGLNMLATRSISIQNVRDAGFPSSMIHVDRGIGRYILPLATFSHDRRSRFLSGARLQSRFGLFYDLTTPGEVKARYRLYDGEMLLGEKAVSVQAEPGSQTWVDLDFPLPSVTEDRVLRLEARAWLEKSGRGFYDDVPVTIFADRKPGLPAGQKLFVFDPDGRTAKYLGAKEIPFTTLQNLGAWEPSPDSFLLVGSEGLNHTPPEELAGLGKKVEAGGRLIVLDHRKLPRFLANPLSQSNRLLNTVGRLDAPSELTRGLLPEDFRFWQTRERDQLVSWGPIELPSTGRFRAHLTSGTETPLLEIASGKGRVIFAQVNFQDALGLDPAADRLFANLLEFPERPSPFPDKPTLVVSQENKWISPLQNRLGLIAPVEGRPTGPDVDGAGLIVVSGTEAAARDALQTRAANLKAMLQKGGTLFVYGLDPEGARWLSGIAGSKINVEPFGAGGAMLETASPLVAGLGHGDFFPAGMGDGLDINQPLPIAGDSLSHSRIAGPMVRPITRPANLAEIPVGEGRIIVFLIRSLEHPVPPMVRILSTVLSNAGAPLDPGGGEKDTTKWTFHPIDLAPFVNWPLADRDGPGQRRGWHLGGADNDLREFPYGPQNFRGIDYVLSDPAQNKGNGVIGLSGANPKIPELPREIKGIPINRKAERLYFLHNSAWGVPEFIYRVYYLEDRKAWIPGKPDPFVDVVVKPGENIQDWWFGSAVDKSEKFLPGATVAWLGDNPATRRSNTRVGVYQMTWDNPHPEKTIESVDILSTGHPGDGNAYIFGITAASRSREETARPPLEKVLPHGVKTSDVFEQIQFERYGAVLLNDGTLASIYDTQGHPFAEMKGWRVQSSLSRPGQPRQHEELGSQSGEPARITAHVEGARHVYEIIGNSKNSGPLNWKARLTATPGSLRYELDYTPRRVPKEEGWEARLHFGLGLSPETKADNRKPNENPVRIETFSGLATLAFDSRYTSWFRSYAVHPNGITFYSPPYGEPPYTIGQKETIWWELAMP